VSARGSVVSRLHHIGMVVEDVQAAAAQYRRWFGFAPSRRLVVDPVQQVRTLFLQTGQSVLLELVEPLSTTSPVARFLNQRGGLHHLCYEVQDLERALETFRRQGALVVRQPVPAVAFRGRQIAFVYGEGQQLIELLEAPNR